MEKMLDSLLDLGILESIGEAKYFNDDPRFYYYFAKLALSQKHTDGYLDKELGASGVSLSNREIALLKCLGETIERYSLSSYKEKKVKHIKADNWLHRKFPLSAFSPVIRENGLVSYIEGINLMKKNTTVIPAKLVYLNYKSSRKEIDYRYPLVSTGAAGGFNFESSVLRGIYEVIERDAFVCAYLNSIRLPMIDINEQKDKDLLSVLKSIKRYNLELSIFDATNDLGIPSFISILVDRTGLGPAVSVGAKAGFNCINAIKGSIDESFMVRSIMRAAKLSSLNGEKVKNEGKFMKELHERGFYWWPVEAIDKLDFLFSQKPSKKRMTKFQGSEKEELEHVVKILSQKGYEIFCADISARQLKKINYVTYKILIPNLQPLYLFEKQKKFVNRKRLKQVADFFRAENVKINQIPHPFL